MKPQACRVSVLSDRVMVCALAGGRCWMPAGHGCTRRPRLRGYEGEPNLLCRTSVRLTLLVLVTSSQGVNCVPAGAGSLPGPCAWESWCKGAGATKEGRGLGRGRQRIECESTIQGDALSIRTLHKVQSLFAWAISDGAKCSSPWGRTGGTSGLQGSRTKRMT